MICPGPLPRGCGGHLPHSPSPVRLGQSCPAGPTPGLLWGPRLLSFPCPAAKSPCHHYAHFFERSKQTNKQTAKNLKHLKRRQVSFTCSPLVNRSGGLRRGREGHCEAGPAPTARPGSWLPSACRRDGLREAGGWQRRNTSCERAGGCGEETAVLLEEARAMLFSQILLKAD